MPRMPKNYLTQLDNEIAQAKGAIPDNISFDPEFHEAEAARILAYDLANDYSLIRASAHASLAASLRLKAMMKDET